MPNGYNGRIARVNLTKRSITVEEPAEGWYRIYMGGGALAAYYLLKELAPGVDPLSPDNILIFACSVVTGSPISGFSRYTVAAKSPLTGAFGESEASGYFGPEMKFSGFDALIIQGKADAPVYLWLHDGQCEIRDASALWGLDNGAAKDALEEELGDKRIRIASIGQAGERLIPFACVINELGHANGRTGMGAVMGSKNLKAVVARGKPENQTYADPERVKAISKWQIERVKDHAPSQFMHKYGTPGLVMGLSSSGILPTRNWRESVFEGADNINGVAMNDTVLKRAATCYRCSVACKRVVEYQDERFTVNPRYGGPEYETLGSFGSLCGVDDLPAICKAHELCNSWGMDTISAGGMIAFAMECFEEGILTAEDNEGRVIKFGDVDGMLWLLEKIVNQEGLGKILSKGVAKASKEIGRGSEQYAFSIKGQEIPLHDPRGKTGVGLGYAVSPTGADHIESPHEGAFVGEAAKLLNPIGVMEAPDPLAVDEVKTAQFRKMQLTWSMNNVLGLCNFAVAPLFSLSYDKMVEAVTAITGWNTSLWDLMLAAERAENMYRVFNTREGFGIKDDQLFKRLHEPISGGPLKGVFIDRETFKKQLKMYYKIMGWDENGVPTREKLIDLNLGWLTEQ